VFGVLWFFGVVGVGWVWCVCGVVLV